LVPLHRGKRLQPQNFPPAFLPTLAVLTDIPPPQIGHLTLGELLGRTAFGRGTGLFAGGGITFKLIFGIPVAVAVAVAVAVVGISLLARSLANHFSLPALYATTAQTVAPMLSKNFIAPTVRSTPPWEEHAPRRPIDAEAQPSLQTAPPRRIDNKIIDPKKTIIPTSQVRSLEYKIRSLITHNRDRA